MDELLLDRLKLLSKNIETLSRRTESLVSLNDDSVYEAEMISAKLKGLLARLQEDLNQYFRLVNFPAADEISEISVTQLSAEENLSELDVKLKLFSRTKEDVNNARNFNVASTSSSCRLPKLNLPEYEGDILNWHQFWDQFQSNIHNRNIPEVDKLLYLKSCVKGDAQKVIDGFETTNKNYAIAIETLKSRFGKGSHLIDAHYAALSKVTTSDSTILSCRKTYNEIEKHLRVLESLGEDVNHNHLRHLIFAKFPEDLIYELKLKTRDDSISEIRRYLEGIITAREDANRITKGNSSKDAQNYTVETLHVTQANNNNKARDRPPMRRGFRQIDYKTNQTFNKPTQGFQRGYAGQQENTRFQWDRNHNERDYRKKMRTPCVFCQGGHYNDQCNKYKNVRERVYLLRGKCYLCFEQGHHTNTCSLKTKCVYCGSKGLHNRALCPKVFSDKPKSNTTTLATRTVTNASSRVYKKGHTVLQTAIVNARRDRDDPAPLRCRVLFDSGSQRTYVTKSMARQLKLTIVEEESLSVYTFGSKSPQEFESPIVKIELETRSKEIKTIYANVVPMISQGVPYVEGLHEGEYRHKLADNGSLENRVDILIGNDYYYSFLLPERAKICEDLYLVDSVFGLVLSGKLPTPTKEDDITMSVITYFQTGLDFKLRKPDTPLDQGNIDFLWELESIGITDSPKVTRDEEAIAKFNETTKLINNRYHVSWPWNEYPPTLAPNYGLAQGRLVNLIKRLDEDTLRSYNETIKDQISKGVVEEVSVARNEDHPVHYLPHHCVSQKGKPIRIVYDASAKIKGNKSLNECLYCGPLLLEDLTCLLIRFRSHNIALTADVEKAFLQIGLHEKDRDVTRFLWVRDIEKPPVNENIVCMRFCRVPFGIISSPFLLNATIKHHLSKGNERIKQMAKDIYVDNLVTGVQSEGEALQLYKDSKNAFQEISMNLRDWSSNSDHFMNKVPDTSKEKIVKILGLDWHLEQDTLSLRFEINTDANSKREVLKVVASVFDPCGFTVPHTLPAKLFLQELWQTKVKWDTSFSKEMKDKWNEIKVDLESIRTVTIPRCFLKKVKSGDYHLHCFTDASLKAYAAVVYVTHGTKRSFVIGKSRLVPIKDQKSLSIPRLELLAVLIGCRLIKMVLKAFNSEIGYQTLWTDSQIAIEWCKSNKLLPPFIARRVEEIKRNKELLIKYVPSELNPADIATRPIGSADDKRKWLEGPEFLSESINTSFPTTVMSQAISLSTREGLSNNPKNTDSKEDKGDNSPEKTVKSIRNESYEIKQPLSITDEIKKLQAEHFSREVAGKETDLSRNLKLFKDIDGVLRCKGRLQNADLSFDIRYPILIPRRCDFTHKLIEKVHSDNYHVGANHTLSLIRQSYWIPQGKSQVQQVLRKCPRCVKHGGGPFKLPPTPALPTHRVNYSAPFNYSALDYFGPVQVKDGQGVSKRWIGLFTCLVVRAVHLEVVKDLTAEEGLLALRRMVATRGVPTLVTSDNASNFKLISEVLSKPYCVRNEIKWKFIPQLAPWFGGYYERLIGIVKNCMMRTLGKHMLTDTQLATVVKEIEAVVNTRPLTCVDAELDIILKPTDFLTPGRCVAMEESFEDCVVNGTAIKVDLLKGWRKGLVILREFKNMFINRYLTSLRERYHHSLKEPRVTAKLSPTIGQVVQIKADNKNRETWKIGKIVSLKMGSDGACRVAVVKVGDKEFTRSIAHLYPLEVLEEEAESENEIRETYTSKEDFPVDVTEYISEDTKRPSQETIEQPTTTQSDTIQEMTEQPIILDESIQDIDQEEPDQQMEETNTDTDSGRITTLERDVEGSEKETRVKRVAATKALQKIKEWTNCLSNILTFPAGSVANLA